MRLWVVMIALVVGALSAAHAQRPLLEETAFPSTPGFWPGFPTWKPAPFCLKKNNQCNGNKDCCKGEFCFRCPFCDNQFNRPGTCLGENDARPGCAPPPPCETVCPSKECSGDKDCCPGQTCSKCPICPGIQINSAQSKGTCVSKTGLVTEPKCKPCAPPPPPPPPPNNQCKSGADCPKGTFCNRCPRCEGPNGSVFNGPGTCGRFIRDCAAPPPCETVCPSKECSGDKDCCPGQTCSKCPICPGVLTGRLRSKGTCVSKTGLVAKPKCKPCGPPPPPPDNKCESQSQCPKGFNCNRCPRCEGGPNGVEYNGPGTCGKFIIDCARPPPCGGLFP